MRRFAKPSTLIVVLASSFFAATAHAQDTTAPPAGTTEPTTSAPSPNAGAELAATPPPHADEPAAVAPEAKPKPAPYSVPWKLRPAIPLTVILWDSQLAKYEDANANGGMTFATTLLAGYKITPEFAVMARWGFVTDSAPAPPGATLTASGTAFTNPALGAFYGMKFSDFKLGLFMGMALPFGSGGGDNPDPFKTNARVKGVYGRAAMDNAMFAVNDFVLFPGAGLAYVKGGWTVQVEATILQLIRARGDGATGAPNGAVFQPEAMKTNLTSGLHVGYFVIPQMSITAELHYQRWLNAPIGIEAAEAAQDAGNNTRAVNLAASQRDQASFQIGPRFHFKLTDKIWTRPGIAYERGIDLPMAGPANYHNIQLHWPVIFP